MKRDRKSLSLLLGLVLMVQGVAVSAAPCTMTHEAPDAATSVSMDADMPCHGQKDEAPAAATSNADLSCCGSDCPNMGNCMLGHAAINPGFLMTTDHSPDVAPRLVPVRVISLSPSSLLRPPISLHG